LIKIKDLLLKNRSPNKFCSYNCNKNLLTKDCPYLIRKQNNNNISNPLIYVCGKKFLLKYQEKEEKISEKNEDVLKLFAKPKTDCLLKEKKFKIEKKKNLVYEYMLCNHTNLSKIFLKLFEEKFACYDIEIIKLNKFASVYKFKFIDTSSNLLLFFNFYKDGTEERVISFFISKKENEFYKISGGV